MTHDAPFVSFQRVHWDMLDLMGVLHNAAYLLLFERARTDLWRSLGAMYGSDGFDWPYLVVRNEVNYRAPIESDQEVQVTVAVSRLGRSSITFAHTVIRSDGVLAADGSTVIARVDAETRSTAVPWSDAFRKLVAPYMLPARE